MQLHHHRKYPLPLILPVSAAVGTAKVDTPTTRVTGIATESAVLLQQHHQTWKTS